MVIHYAPRIDEEAGTSWTLCGRLVDNRKLYRGDVWNDEVTCKMCLRGLDAKMAQTHRRLTVHKPRRRGLWLARNL